jgi:hypothetical protein
MPRTALLLLLALGPLAGCRTVSGWFDRSELPISGVERDNAAEHVAEAETEIERGDLGGALERLIALRGVQNLQPEVRLQSEGLLERATSQLLAEGADDLDLLESLWELDLSPRMRARAGIRYAERLYEVDHRVKAWKQVRDVEHAIPNHTERSRAGVVLARVGLDLIEDSGHYLLVMSYDARGAAALEFLVLNYPLDPGCDQAYAALARYYEREGELELAIARNEDLFTYRQRSELAVHALAEIPRLRLKLIDEPDHDRGEILRALGEARAWLERHPEHPLLAEVQDTERACRRALARSDLVLGRYYDRIDNEFGARLHAGRAVVEARDAGAESLAAEAQALLDDLGPPPEPQEDAEPDAAEQPDAGAPAAAETAPMVRKNPR